VSHSVDPEAVMNTILALFAADRQHRVTWSDIGHPEYEGEPILQTYYGPVQIPPYPPAPGY
jgi:hypothetical protein